MRVTRTPATDSQPRDAYSRDDESLAERLDRNYAELLQELRVAQTGVQILFAFLLTIAFQQRFPALSKGEHALYVVTLLFAIAAAILLIAPSGAHRVLFRQHRKDEIVRYGSLMASCGLACLACAILMAALFTLTVVTDFGFAIAVCAVLLVLVVLTWLVAPWRWRARARAE